MPRPDMHNRPDKKINLGFGDLFSLIGSGRRGRSLKGQMVQPEEFAVVDVGSDTEPLLVSRYEHNGQYSSDPKSRLGPPTEFPKSKYYRISHPLQKYFTKQQIEAALARDAGGKIDPEDGEAVSRGIRRPRRIISAPHKKSKQEI